MPAGPARTSSCPGPDRTVSRPCMRSASSRAIARPSPAPCACSLEVKNGSKMCGMFWRLIPGPRSATSSRTCPFDRAAETRTPVPGGVWRSALSSRIRSTWATRSGSQSSSIGSGRRSSSTSDSCRAASRRELRRDLTRELPDVRRLDPQLQRAGLQPREVEQLDRQVAHAVDLAADLLQERAPRLLVEVLVGQQLQEPAQGEDRRAQLVRRGRDELLARPIQPRELVLHVVERARRAGRARRRSRP